MTTARTSTARHRHTDVDTGTDVNWNKVVNAFKFVFFFIGFIYGLSAAVKANEDDLGSMPGVNLFLAQTISLYFYKSFLIIIMITGTIAQSGINLGLSLDIATEFFKEGRKADNTMLFLYGSNTKNAAHVFGSLFGIATTITYLSHSNARFKYPFGAEKGVPPVLMGVGAPFLIGGACSNLWAYSVDGLREVIYGFMLLTNMIGPKLVRLTPCPTFNLEGYNPDLDFTFANLFKLLGGIIGHSIAINGSVRLTEEHIEFPYVTHETDTFIPLAFYHVSTLLFVSGIIINFFYHFGLALDKLVELIKTFPTNGSAHDFKVWLFDNHIKDAAHVVGMLFGLGLAITFINNDVNNDNAEFIFPSAAQMGIPAVIMRMLMIIYLSGAYANIFSFFIDSLRQAYRGGKVCTKGMRKTAETVLPFSIFSKSNPSPAPPILPFVVPPSPIPIPPYATPGAIYRKGR